jgi:hypothetical protein
MNYRIEDLISEKVIKVKCVKNGSYTILSVEYNDNNKVEILKMVLDFVSKLN